MSNSFWITALLFIADALLRLGISIRVIMRRLPVGVSLAWLMVIFTFPFAGTLLYLVLGEYRLGRKRQQRIATAGEHWTRLMTAALPAEWSQPANANQDRRLPSLAETAFRATLLPGNRLTLLEDAEAAFASLITDIDAAQKSCDFEFYIWVPGGRVDDVAAALVRAAGRGVRCRLLVDALGSGKFLKSREAAELRRQGIQVQAALPSSLLSMPFVRPDLRLHRKIVVIDRKVGYTGSLNMADPRTFKQDAGVGQWVDAFARLEGAGVHALAASFLAAWSIETAEDHATEWKQDRLIALSDGPASVQVLPTGPAYKVGAIEQFVLSAIYSARREVTLTTPYFVPSESLLSALLAVASSGVQVTLIVPAKVDSRMVNYASQAYQSDLVAAGVRVALFQGGLLHTKSITVDDEFSLFGSLNLDPRSMRLNFEISLAIYDRNFTADLKALQAQYLDRCKMLDLQTCRNRSPLARLVENTARLLGPLL